MVVEVHETKNGLVLDVRLVLITDSMLFLALVELVLVYLHIQTGQDVFKNRLLDNSTLKLIDLF